MLGGFQLPPDVRNAVPYHVRNMGPWENVRWRVVLNGIADAWLWGFDADGWRLRPGDPARGMLGILPMQGGRRAGLDDAVWLADAIAFAHSATTLRSESSRR